MVYRESHAKKKLLINYKSPFWGKAIAVNAESMHKNTLEERATILLSKHRKKELARKSIKNKRMKKRNVNEEIQQIRKALGEVKQFTSIHYRIRGHLDIWPTTHRFYSLQTRRKGVYKGIEDLMNEIELAEIWKRRHESTRAEIEQQNSFFKSL